MKLWLLAALLCLGAGIAQADIMVDARHVLRQKPPILGGVVINAHSPEFATNANGIEFQRDLKAAGIKLVRSQAYPDARVPGHDLTYFDRNVTAILGTGAAPLFIQGIKPGAAYKQADGTPGGTVAGNLVFLVKRYLAPPYQLQTQYWEIGNEPDMKVDYAVATPEEYAVLFNACVEALTQADLREHVVLCGPAIAYGYHEPWWDNDLHNMRSRIMDTFLDRCRGSVDVVTYHDYSGGKAGEDLLNPPRHLDNKEDAGRAVTPGDAAPDSPTSDRGLAALLARMRAMTFARPLVGVGITEHNTYGNRHEVTQGLWNLALLRDALYDPLGRLSTLFVFDDYGAQQGFPVYNENKKPDYAYWALWINGNLRGPDVLAQTTTGHLNPYGRPSLLATATQDQAHLFVEVINRSDTPIMDTVTVTGEALTGQAQVSTMATGILPNVAKPVRLRPRFPYAFPPLSATMFQFVRRRH